MHKANYMHKVSRKIVECMEANSINTLFVGKNVGWKDSIKSISQHLRANGRPLSITRTTRAITPATMVI